MRHILFIDIETATQSESYDVLSKDIQRHWERKMRRHVSYEDYPSEEEELSALYHDKAAIYAEFGKVICISVGYLYQEGDVLKGKIKSYYGDDEKVVLASFFELLHHHYYDRHNQYLCGHNIKEFDIPYLCRRAVINELALPNMLQIAGYKPWQVHHLLDTLELWKYGDYKHYTSLSLLCDILGIDTPKDGMDGSMVSDAYWSGNLDDIVSYCQRDVLATIQVYLRCSGQPKIDPNEVEIV